MTASDRTVTTAHGLLVTQSCGIRTTQRQPLIEMT
jgi:hypothetical protein